MRTIEDIEEKEDGTTGAEVMVTTLEADARRE